MLERFGDEKGRFGPLAGEKPLGKGGDEDDRNIDLGQNILHRINSRTVIGELDIGQHQARLLIRCLCHCLVARHGNAGNIMAEIANNGFDVHRDDRLILDNQHICFELRFDILFGFGDQRLHFLRGLIQQIADFRLGKAFDLGQEQCLAGKLVDHRQPRCSDRFGAVGITGDTHSCRLGAPPDLEERPV